MPFLYDSPVDGVDINNLSPTVSAPVQETVRGTQRDTSSNLGGVSWPSLVSRNVARLSSTNGVDDPMALTTVRRGNVGVDIQGYSAYSNLHGPGSLNVSLPLTNIPTASGSINRTTLRLLSDQEHLMALQSVEDRRHRAASAIANDLSDSVSRSTSSIVSPPVMPLPAITMHHSTGGRPFGSLSNQALLTAIQAAVVRNDRAAIARDTASVPAGLLSTILARSNSDAASPQGLNSYSMDDSWGHRNHLSTSSLRASLPGAYISTLTGPISRSTQLSNQEQLVTALQSIAAVRSHRAMVANTTSTGEYNNGLLSPSSRSSSMAAPTTTMQPATTAIAYPNRDRPFRLLANQALVAALHATTVLNNNRAVAARGGRVDE